jgi:homotetrameric cytidine deaminase
MMDRLDEVFQAAQEAKERAYAPFSQFRVGSALMVSGDDTIYSGCNVENSSYGASMCAERVALFRMLATRGVSEPQLIVVASDVEPPAVPCALCLQVIAEFAPASLPIYMGNAEGIRRELRLGDLLPEPFLLNRS